MTIASLLNRSGHSLQLKIGARKESGNSLIAHAWLEDAEGQVVAEELDDLEQYSRLRKS